MNQFLRLLFLSFATLSAFFIKDTYISNAELAELRHSHFAKNHR